MARKICYNCGDEQYVYHLNVGKFKENLLLHEESKIATSMSRTILQLIQVASGYCTGR